MKELLRAAFSQFEKNQIATVDAEILLAHLLGVSRKQIHSQIIELSDADQEKISGEYNELISQRLMGRPVQYITGSAPFRYLDLEVGEGVLIPRPETELIVDRVIGVLNSDLDKVLPKSVVDLGAGSGAISIAIASAERKSQVRTVDRSERIRTYNFPENRLSDHRVNYKANNLDSVMNGDLDAVIQSLLDADRTSKLSAGNS